MSGLGISFQSGFSIGTDVSISIVQDQTGQVVILEGRLTSIEESADDVLIKTQPLDNGGIPDFRVLPDGWSGMLEWDRQNDVFSAYMASLELGIYNGGTQVTHTITSTKKNVNGTTSRSQLLRALFHQYKPGTWTKTAAVKGRVNIVAQQRVQLQ